jgi:8-oxo-dGTP diphosphatase
MMSSLNCSSEMIYCPRCAHPLEDRFVFERTRRVCPACGFIFFPGPKVGAGVLAERDGLVLLVRRAVPPKEGWWCLPSGFVEYDEAPEVAAQRECTEETGLTPRITGLLGVYHYSHDFRGPGILIVYAAQVGEGEPRPGSEISEVRFFGPDELPEQIAFTSNRQVLERWCREKAGSP